MAAALILISCKPKTSTEPVCVKLTKDDLKKWVTDGYIDSASLPKLAIRFRAAYAFPGKGYAVFAGLQDSTGKLIEASIIQLQVEDTCSKTHIHLSPFIFTGVIPANLTDWPIWTSSGKVNDSLDYIRLEPDNYKYKDFQFLQLNDFVYKAGTRGPIQVPHKTMFCLAPCPPCENCRLPCPEPCNSCGAKTDTLQ